MQAANLAADLLESGSNNSAIVYVVLRLESTEDHFAILESMPIYEPFLIADLIVWVFISVE